MCGRTLIGESKALAWKAGLEEGGEPRERDSNRPPGTEMPVIVDARPGKLHYIKWGLIPAASVEPPKFNTAYARIETMHALASYRELVGRRHCVFVVEGLYEWHRDSEPKQPYFIRRRDQRLLYLAGLWDTWKDPRTGIVIPTCTMIMQPSTDYMANVHDRMPCILSQADSLRWLDRELPVHERLAVLRKPVDGLLEGWPVNRKVNNARNKDDDNPMPLGQDTSLFD